MKLLLAALLLTGCAAAPEPARADVTYRIEGLEGGVCSATAVGTRWLLTAAHCIKEGTTVLLINGTLYGVMDVERDGKDHALVYVTKTFPEIATLGPAPKVGDRVHWVGQPMGLHNVYGEGQMVGTYEDRQLIDGSVWFGVSGSGLFDANGKLVGVVSGILGQQIYKLGFAWPLAFTQEQWAEVK